MTGIDIEDKIYEKLKLHAIQKNITVKKLCNTILDDNLEALKIVRDEK